MIVDARLKNQQQSLLIIRFFIFFIFFNQFLYKFFRFISLWLVLLLVLLSTAFVSFRCVGPPKAKSENNNTIYSEIYLISLYFTNRRTTTRKHNKIMSAGENNWKKVVSTALGKKKKTTTKKKKEEKKKKNERGNTNQYYAIGHGLTRTKKSNKQKKKKEIPPSASDPSITIIDANGDVVYTKPFNDKVHLWCDHCRRWTASHHTETCQTHKKIDTRLDDIGIDNNETAITEMSALSLNTTPHNVSTPRSCTDEFPIDSIKKEWSPVKKRDRRFLKEHRSFKVQHDGTHQPIVGGDWITGAAHEPMTLSFAFNGAKNTEYAGKRYGVTCAHIIPTIYSTTIPFENSEIYLVTSNRVNARGRLITKRIGTVVSVDRRHDSLIFEFLPNINVDANTIRLSSKTIHKVDFSDGSTLKGIMNEVDNISAGTELIGFGSQRRGFNGMVQGIASKIIPCWDSTRHETLNGGDIGIDSFDPRNVEAKGSKMITHDGDCGMISFNKHGVPLVMHRVLSTYKKDNEPCQYRSWGVPLSCVFRAHGRYFGFYDSSKGIEKRYGLPVLSPKPWNVVQSARYEFEFLPGEEPKRVNCYPFVKAPSNGIGIKFDFEDLPGEEPNEVD